MSKLKQNLPLLPSDIKTGLEYLKDIHWSLPRGPASLWRKTHGLDPCFSNFFVANSPLPFFAVLRGQKRPPFWPVLSSPTVSHPFLTTSKPRQHKTKEIEGNQGFRLCMPHGENTSLLFGVLAQITGNQERTLLCRARPQDSGIRDNFSVPLSCLPSPVLGNEEETFGKTEKTPQAWMCYHAFQRVNNDLFPHL